MSGKERDPRPYKCPFPNCYWTFSRQEHQTRHMRTHSGERPFVCDHPGCPSRFARNDELKRHQRLMEHGPASSRQSHEAALADGDQVVYNGGHSRRQSEQIAAGRSPHAQPGVLHHSSSSSNRDHLPPRPATSMNTYSSSGYARQPPQSSRVVQPSPRHPGHSAAFMPAPATPMHPPLPLHYRAPTAGGRAFTPVTLPPLQTNRDGYTTDSGRRERRVQLPGFSEVAGQPRYPDHSRR